MGYLMTPEQWHRRNHGSIADPRTTPEMANCWRCQRAVAICKSKKTFPDNRTAADGARSQNIEMGWERPVYPYPCRHCGAYHVATAKKARKVKRVEKQRRKWLRESAA